MIKTFTDLMQKYIQKLKQSRRSRALLWLNKDIHQIMKKRVLALKQSLVTKNNSDTLIFKGLRKKVTKELRMAKTCYFMQPIADSKGKSTALRKHLNILTNRASNMRRSDVELNINGTVSNDVLEIANEFKIFFFKSVEELATNFRPVDSKKYRKIFRLILIVRG